MNLVKPIIWIAFVIILSSALLLTLSTLLNTGQQTNYQQPPAEAAVPVRKPLGPPSILLPTPTVSSTNWLPVLLNNYSNIICDPYDNNPGGNITGTLRIWHPTTISFSGPTADESDIDPNPFLDYRLQVYLVAPDGDVFNVPGFFAGDGQGNGAGDIWQARFSPDQIGTWHYCATFRAGQAIAVELDADVGVPVYFDGVGGSFTITDSLAVEPGFLGWGRLEYTNTHYLKFRNGPYWIKGGTNSPENFLGYAGFDNTEDQGGIVNGFLHTFSPHVIDWQPGDPDFTNEDGTGGSRGIIGALNYLSESHVNSIYFLPMNLGGDGQETYPFISPGGSHFDNTHYDISKLYQWDQVLNHAQNKGIALHFVLNETEAPNRLWLDNGTLGIQRKLFYRELVARFSYLLAIKWNLSEESAFPSTRLYEFATYLSDQDWADHIIAVHTPSDNLQVYPPLMGSPLFSATSFQYSKERANEFSEYWRDETGLSGRPWVVDMDENNPAGTGLTDTNADELRKEILYDVYFSGGNIEWYAGYHDPPLGGDMQLENFRTREAMWDYMWYGRNFMEENLPFWEMHPADELLEGEDPAFGGGEVFAKEGEIYAIYLPSATLTSTLFIDDVDGNYFIHWYNPRTGEMIVNNTSVSVANNLLSLGEAPYEPEEDWVILVVNTLYGRPDTHAAGAYP